MPAGLQHSRVHLASRSPRRRELLAQIGVGFDTIVFRDAHRGDRELDETPLPDEDALAYVERIAYNKASLGWRIVNWLLASGRSQGSRPSLRTSAWRCMMRWA